LAAVHIVSNSEPPAETASGADGRFGLYVTVQQSGGPGRDTLEFSLPSYSDKRVALTSPGPSAGELALGEVKMTRANGGGIVRGSVTASDSPVPQAHVLLRSTDNTGYYETTSDAGGSFVMADVAIGEYTLSVVPVGNYHDHTESSLKIGAAGLELRIALEPLTDARLHGQMLDIHGTPIPGFSLWLKNRSAGGYGSWPLLGDAHGFFDAPGVPAGDVALMTYSVPRISISGVTLVDSNDPPLQLILDVGDHVLEGRVFDSSSNAIPGAQVSLSWSHESDGIVSRATRDTTTDTGGYFRFSQLGPGVHTLSVTAAGFQSRSLEQAVEAGGEMAIELSGLTSTWRR
jgi:hypothetical protein